MFCVEPSKYFGKWVKFDPRMILAPGAIAMEPILVITNLPDEASAMALARKLVDERLAACVNVFDGCTSVYRWQGKKESAREVPIFIKTLAQHYAQLEQLINAMHPYELPEIIAVPIGNGLPAYLKWIADETSVSDTID
jgi:periplasmic divalent cation tolerance protein